MTQSELLRAIVRRETARLEADLEAKQRHLDEVAETHARVMRQVQEARAVLAGVRELLQEMER